MSNTSLLLFFSLLPIVLILVIIYNIDKTKEPLFLLMALFCLGMISCFIVVKVSDLLGIILPFMSKPTNEFTFLDTILYAFIGVAFIEEFCKWLVTYFIGYKNKEFDEVYDIVVYSVFMSLGFAFFENIVYVFFLGEVKVALLRAILAVPAHACYAIFMGYYLSNAKISEIQNNKSNKLKYIGLSILIPVVLHGIYDYCLMSGIVALIGIFVVFIIFLDIVSIKKIKEILANNKDLQS